MLRTKNWALCACTALVLSACGGGSSGEAPPAAVDPLQKYRDQTVAWTACDPSILARTSPVLDGFWTRLGGRLQCGTVRAPLDYAQPGRGEVAIGMMRIAAGEPTKRRGALVFNPGGPGTDGLNQTFSLFAAFADSNPADPLGAMNLRLLAEYDMVGFSPRGTGASTRLQCATNELERFVDRSAAGLAPANIANQNYNAMKGAEACLRNPVTPFINTDATARDMDLLRGLLGDAQLNYVGYSYGTWLGAWYANLFPDRVGRMVLDSYIDFSSSSLEEAFLMQPPARQRLLDEVMVPYAVRHASHFNLGATPADVRAVMPALSSAMQHVLAGPLSTAGYSRGSADSYLEYIAAARGLDGVLKAVEDPADPDAVLNALRQQAFIPADAVQDAVVRGRAEQLYRSYYDDWVEFPRTSISIGSSDAVYWAVRCNDTPSTTDLGAWFRRAQAFSLQYPMFFSVSMLSYCAYWGGPSVNKPDLKPLQGLDVLLVQSQYDSATATEGADALFSVLPNARRVYVPGDYQHGVYPAMEPCVDTTVTAYLLGQTPPQRQINCPAQALPQDKALAPTLRGRSVESPSTTYKHPVQAREHIEQFKGGLVSPLDKRGARP